MDELFQEFGINVKYKSKAEFHLGTIENLFESGNLRQNDSFHKGEEVLNVKFYPLGGVRLLLLLQHPASLYFRGILGIKCLAGGADIDGFILTSDTSNTCCAYSMSTHGACGISTVDGIYCSKEEIINALHDMSVDGDDIGELSSLSCLLMLWKEEFPALLKLKNELQSIIHPKRWTYSGSACFSVFEEFVNCVFDLPSGDRISKKIMYSQKMRDFSRNICNFDVPRLTVCGGKGVGKSTYIRFLINQMLPKWGEIIFIDFDIGQPEFTVPGCISVHSIKKPLLGPTYTHLNSPLKSIFLGFVSPDMCFNNYRSAIKEIKNYFYDLLRSSSIPCVINTMGYVKGIGLLLINDIISSFDLTHVVELRSTTEPKVNFSHPPTPHFLMKSVTDCLPLNYTFETFQQTTSNQKSGVSAKLLRELMALFYLVSSPSLKVLKVILQKDGSRIGVPFVSFLENSFPQKGEMVAVCTSEPTNDLKHCIGFGNVLSFAGGILDLVTPLSETDLENCIIVKGDLSLRNNFFCENLTNFEDYPLSQHQILLTSGEKSLCPSLFYL